MHAQHYLRRKWYEGGKNKHNNAEQTVYTYVKTVYVRVCENCENK